MTVLLLVIIYLAFISLGLPDSVLGVTLPALQLEWGISLGSGGVISLSIIGSTIVSSFISGYIIEKLGTGRVTFFSTLLTGLSLLGFSLTPSYLWFLILAVPLGLGAGTIDTALNNYIALHFKAHHMNWLHSFWGVGATASPLLMSWIMHSTGSWRNGYRVLACIQIALSFFMFLSLPLWRKHKALSFQSEEAEPRKTVTVSRAHSVIKIPGVSLALGTMLFYCAAEASLGLWGSNYLIHIKQFSIERAALFMALYFGGITMGRFISGFISFRLSNRLMIRYGILISLAGIILLFFPLPDFISGFAFILTGLGFAPVFPSILHETPVCFGREMSQRIIGYQIGFAATGSALFPPLLGFIMQTAGLSVFPVLVAGFISIILLTTERLSVICIKS